MLKTVKSKQNFKFNFMDQLLFWNDVALEANRVSHTNGVMEETGPPHSARALAMVHLALYDAYVNTTSGTPLPFYCYNISCFGNGDQRDVAMATAAASILRKFYPAQHGLVDRKYKEAGLKPNGMTKFYQLGLDIAHEIWNDRADDPKSADQRFVQPIAKGLHREDPDNDGQGTNAPFYGSESKCFAVTKRWGIKAHPALGSAKYIQALRQVRAKGIKPELTASLPATLIGNRRTTDETLMGIYWGYDGAAELGTPPRMYNQILRELAIHHNNSLEQNVELFTKANVAMADAGILAWEQKYRYNHWRPVVGIREHDDSMGFEGATSNPVNSDCDPSWLPLGAPKTNGKKTGGPDEKNFTPPFPAYPSGHATFGAAALHVARIFFDSSKMNNFAPDNLFDGLDFVSDEYNGVSKDNRGTIRPRHRRSFPGGLWQMIFENGISRVFLGVHWHYDAFEIKPGALSAAGDAGRNVTMDEIDIDLDLSTPSECGTGGVPLGLAIAQDLFTTRGVTKSTV
jgi:hypothetical protein